MCPTRRRYYRPGRADTEAGSSVHQVFCPCGSSVLKELASFTLLLYAFYVSRLFSWKSLSKPDRSQRPTRKNRRPKTGCLPAAFLPERNSNKLKGGRSRAKKSPNCSGSNIAPLSLTNAKPGN